MSKYLTEEQEKQLAIALLAVEGRTTSETLADALEGKTGYKEEYKQLRRKAGAYDLILWEAISSLTGKEIGDFFPNKLSKEVEEKLERALKEAPDFPADQ